MAVTINASTSAGLVQTADTSGVLALQTAGTTAVTIDASQRTAFVAGTAALPAITTTGDTNTGIFFPAADTIAFSEGGVESMRLDSNGSLAIGGTTVVTNNGGITATTTSSGSVAATLGMRNAGTANGSGTTLVFRGVSNASAEHDYAYVAGVADDTTAKTGSIRFSTTAGSSPVERARITSGGGLLVGTSASIGNGGIIQSKSTSAAALYAETNSSSGSQNVFDIANVSNTAYVPIRFWVNGYGTTQVGSISVTTSATAYNTSSDYRLKNSIAPMTGALAKVALLKPCTYKWNADGSDGEGFIAHELAEVCPSAVTGAKDAVDADGNIKPQGIDVSFLVATLTAAIQEQQALITQLQADVAALKGA